MVITLEKKKLILNDEREEETFTLGSAPKEEEEAPKVIIGECVKKNINTFGENIPKVPAELYTGNTIKIYK